jgi:hypothetical protein
MRYAGYVSRMGEQRNAFKVLAGNREGNTQLGIPRLK